MNNGRGGAYKLYYLIIANQCQQVKIWRKNRNHGGRGVTRRKMKKRGRKKWFFILFSCFSSLPLRVLSVLRG
jgi:hypothetical protein